MSEEAKNELNENDKKPVVAYGVYRHREDENHGQEFFFSADWHDDYIAQEGERKVAGFFLPVTAIPWPVPEGLTGEQLAQGMAQAFVQAGIRQAIAQVEELGRGSKGMPLTPGFIAHKLRTMKPEA
jgi:hypothetical protein